MFAQVVPLPSHRHTHRLQQSRLPIMLDKSKLTVISNITLTIVCSTALAILVVIQSSLFVSVTAIALLLVLLAAQFSQAKYYLVQIIRTERYHKLGRKLVHNKQIEKRDEVVALKILNHIVNQPLEESEHATIWQSSYENFSGDLAMTCQSECGNTYMLVADLTGHGIAAAMGATPVASIFQATARRGLDVDQIMVELNNRLTRLLPSGFFCCAAIAKCDGKKVTVCNAGLPDIIIATSTGEITDRVESTQLPLGIEELKSDDVKVFTKSYTASHQLYAYTDGLIETQSTNDEIFDPEKLEILISSQAYSGSRIPTIQKGFETFVKGSQQNDDISIVEVNIC